MSGYRFEEFMDIIRKLRSEEGCPWDREQTHESLRNCLLEECYETIEAINNRDNDNLCEELGDVLLQVALHSVIAEEKQEFTIDQVITGEAEKMIRRHPHVFGGAVAEDSEGVLKNWEEIKKQEKGSDDIVKELLGVPKAFPAMLRAEKIQKKAAKAGMNPEGLEQALKRVQQGLKELEKGIESGNNRDFQEEIGEVLFGVVNLSRILQIDAENSLTNATNKFINRFVDIFAQA